jgi:predicted RNA-binding protein with PUA-like domain
MHYWLVKSEPFKWSWDQQVAAKTTLWDGVRNYQAANNLRAMKKGDLAFFYHSNEGKEIVGIAEISAEATPDKTDPTGKFVVVEVKAKEKLPRPVTLAEIKADPALQDLALIRQSRLSVVPVSAAHWAHICKLAGVKA